MRNTILSFAFLFCGFAPLLAQTGDIKGKVISEKGKPMPNVSVMVANTTLGTVTNKEGAFELTRIEAGDYEVKISYLGYVLQKRNISVRSGQTITVPNVVLVPSEEMLKEVVVEGQMNKYVAREPSASLRLGTELVKLPQNIQIIGKELLLDQQVTSIMDGVIRNVSGVTMLEHWGHFARVNMRGFRIPAFRNGFNFGDDWGPLAEDMNTVERIELVKGPAGFMISAGEPGGFYNVVTKKPTETLVANISAVGGSFDFYRGTMDVGGKISKNGKFLGRFNAVYQTGDTHRGNEQATRYGIAPSITYNITDQTTVNAELNLQQAESFIGAAYVFAPADDGFGSLDRDFRYVDTNYPASDIQEVSLFGSINHNFSEKWSITGKLAYLHYDQVGNSAWIFDPDGPNGPLSPINDNGNTYRNANIWDALSLGKYAQVFTNVEFATFGAKHKTLVAFDFTEKEYWADFNQSSPVDTTEPFNIYAPVYGNRPNPEFDRSVALRARFNWNYGFRNRSFYLQDEIGLFEDRTRLTLAGRYVHINTFELDQIDEKFTPRLGLSVDVLPTFTVYGLYDQSFVAQTGLGTVDGTADTSFVIDDPQDANVMEGGIKKTFFDGRLKTTLGAFLITKENILIGNPRYPGQNFSILLGEVESRGIEFDLQGQVTPELNVVLNYANTNVEDEAGNRVAGHARHMTNGWFNYNFNNRSLLKGFGASLGYQYQVDRSTWNWGADNETLLPDYFRLDGALSWHNRNVRVQLNVNNILDDYLLSGSNFADYIYWQSEPGINGRLGITYTF